MLAFSSCLEAVGFFYFLFFKQIKILIKLCFIAPGRKV